MPYQTPEQWAFQDIPTAPEMEKYPDNNVVMVAETYIHMPPVGPDPRGSTRWIMMEHRHAWLYYKSESEERPGVIVPHNYTIEDDVDLPYAPNGAYYDIEANHEWVVLGRLYEIEHVLWVFEVEFPDCG